MLRESFLKIMTEYPAASKEQFAGHKLAAYIRNTFPKELAKLFPAFEDFIWVGPAGQGQWADAPWLAIFDPLVTDTAQDGYYPVYLFTKSLDSVFLSLNQGMTKLRNEYTGVQAREILANRAEILRMRLPEYAEKFNDKKLELQHTGESTRLAFYEPGHAFGVCYFKNNFPPDETIISDLNSMLQLYRLATIRGGIDDLDNIHAIAEEQHTYDADTTLEEKRKLRLHYVIERNSKLAKEAKKVHGYTCQVCEFDFGKTYGKLGEMYIEAHHLVPISKLPKDKKIELSALKDFAVVCANCHRMIHRKGAPESFEDFKRQYLEINK